MTKRVLVTGGAGFIGSHIVERLLAAGHEVGVLDDLSSGSEDNLPEGVAFWRADITGDIAPVFAEFRPQCVVHQAAQVSVSYSMKEPAFDARTNILGSLAILEAARDHGVERVTYASSAAAYGPIETLPLVETMRPVPVSCYGTSKYVVEHYLRTAKTEWGIEWVALRYANVYGPRQNPHGEAGVVAIFSNKILAGEPPTIFGGGELTRDYVFVEDVARANVLAVEGDFGSHPDPVFNVSTESPTTTNRIYALLAEQLGASVEPLRGPDRAGDVQHSLLGNGKLREATGWEPTVALEDGIARTAAWFRDEASRAPRGGS